MTAIDPTALEAARKQVAALRETLEKIAQLQRGKCENASAETLFMLLDNKVSIALAALTDTADATAEYQKVPRGWHVVQAPVEEDTPQPGCGGPQAGEGEG